MKGLCLIVFVLAAVFVQAQSKPSKIQVAETLGDTLLGRQDFAGALKQYNKVAKLNKLKDVEARHILYKRALCYFYLGEFDNAINDLNVFIPENPNLPRARMLRAFLYRETGDLEAQLADLNEALEWDALNIDLLKWRAGLLVEMGKNKEAIPELKKIRAWGKDEEVELYLGLAYYDSNEADSAIFHFDEAIKINGGYLPAYLYAGSLSIEQGAYTLALTYINLALMLEPDNTQLQFYKGIALAETGDKDEGCKYLNKAFTSGLTAAGDYLAEYCYPSRN